MEAAALPPRRELSGDKAARIVEAMRASVAARGIAGATFDHVAREAGVSRGLLHYYFGSKERLLVEAVRREAEVRDELLDRAVAEAASADEVVDALVRSFEEIVGEASAVVTFYELLMLGQRNGEIAAELEQLSRRGRERLAESLSAGAAAGRFDLRACADTVASMLFALADGVTIRRMAEPELDAQPLTDQAVAAARALFA